MSLVQEDAAFELGSQSAEEIRGLIRSHREAGHLSEAIRICEAAKQAWPSSYFFSKVLSDLYFQAGLQDDAFVALGDFIASIRPSQHLLADVAKRYGRFRRYVPQDRLATYARLLSSSLDEAGVNPTVRRAVREIISPDLLDLTGESDEATKALVVALHDDADFDHFVRAERLFEETDKKRLAAILEQYVLDRPRSPATYRIDLHCVSIFEKLGFLDHALKVASELVNTKLDPIAIRSLFRLSRLKKDYSKADELLERNPKLIRSTDFNLLYEFVHYFEANNDFHQVRGILRYLEKSFSTNTPVLRTARNFYVRFGLFDEAKKLDAQLSQQVSNLRGGKLNVEAAVVESESELTSKVQDLYSQLEHQKQLAAISDLTTGISHELGQPITNIRYTLQFYRREFSRSVTSEKVLQVFDSILEETQRMGGLIRRLSPLTSSRTVVETFDLMERIKLRVEGEKPRLVEAGIDVLITPARPVIVVGDPVKVDQLFSNLLQNGIDAISERAFVRENRIEIAVKQKKGQVHVSFSDTGSGIPISNRRKIFDPFFSTKAPGKGEGLGLFIIWNLLTMLRGSIEVDVAYRDGARFLITMPSNMSSPQEAQNDK